MIEVNRPKDVIEAHMKVERYIDDLQLDSFDRSVLSEMIMDCITTAEGNAAREGARHGREQIIEQLTKELKEFIDEPIIIN